MPVGRACMHNAFNSQLCSGKPCEGRLETAHLGSLQFSSPFEADTHFLCLPHPCHHPPTPTMATLAACSTSVALLGQCGGSSSCPPGLDASSCGDNPWAGYCCQAGSMCLRQDASTWRCTQAMPPPPPPPAASGLFDVGAPCSSGADCRSAVCSSGRCSDVFTCYNGIRDGKETHVDW